MASITIDCIEIQGITEPYLLHDLRLDLAPNDHGHATLVLEIKEDGKAENLLQSLDNKMITIESKAKANTGVLFKGYVAGVTISPQLDKVMAEIRLVTATIQMDRKTESCSFQKKEAKYTEILSETAGKDGGVCTYTDDKMKTETIGLPVIRYEESGWEFIRRLASRYWLPVIPDETADKPAFSVGMEPGRSAPEQGFFKKESARFADMGHYIERKLKDGTGSSSMEDYSGMKVRSYNNYKIGMSAAYGGKSLSICAKRAEMEQSELVFTYILGSKELYAPEPRYPEKLHGRSLTGTVVKCENETVKIQLDIDRDSGNTKAEGELYAFPWQPDTGNLMYCMPEKDTIVTLYIGGSNEGEAVAVHSLRNGTEKDTDKPENRYLTTKDKKRMFLKPKELGYSLEDKEEGKTHFILKDGKGITFQTDRKLVVQAKGNLKIAGKDITVEGKKEVNIRQKSAGVEIKNKVNVKGKMTYLGFGATMGEMADQAETLTLKQKPGEETEGKSSQAMTSGKLGESLEKEYFTKEKKLKYIEELYKLAQTKVFRQPEKATNYPRGNRMWDCIVVNFDNNYHTKNPNKKKAEEFPKQLQNQENGLNDLTVAEILLNRHEYFKRKNEAIDRGVKQPSGRSSEGARAQKEANWRKKEEIKDEKYVQLILKFQEENNRDPNEDEEKKLKKVAKNYAKNQMKGKAALHDPDQIAGGYGTNIGGIGDRGVNSSIGSQWEKKNRADGMEDEFWDYINKNDVKPDECIYLFTNIKLKEN